MRFDHASERVGEGVHLMAISQGTLQERLYDAFRVSSHLRSEEFPEDLRAEWEAMKQEISKIGTTANNGRTVITGQMSDERARELIDRFLYIYARVTMEN
jgi:formylmethanofuran dehydrogenase subunit C